ncbi:hypothetical protein C8R47DRAFT_1090254 [Mycena vitilis]|nr:hypothetical protein C8R47DRAFT_1090254 [Mycena vitilis]
MTALASSTGGSITRRPLKPRAKRLTTRLKHPSLSSIPRCVAVYIPSPGLMPQRRASLGIISSSMGSRPTSRRRTRGGLPRARIYGVNRFLSDPSYTQSKPCVAAIPLCGLLLTVFQAHRALNCFKTGKLVMPPQRLGEFSKTNWADRSLVLGGKLIPLRTTSELLDLIKNLKDKQWVRILDAAIAASQASHKPSKAVEVIDVDALTAPPRRVVVDNDSD